MSSFRGPALVFWCWASPLRWNERRADGVPAGTAGCDLTGQTEAPRNEGLTSNASTRIDPGTGLHMTSTDTAAREVVSRDRVVIRFAGDSGDGMQLTGDRFTSETASFGNDLSTLPNFPAEIRAPAGTLPGVSSFQLHFANFDILTPGDRPDVLVAMNPAALKANVADLPPGGDPDREHRRVHQAEPDQGRLHGLAAGRRLAGALHGAPGRDGDADPRCAGADRAVARRTPSGRRTCSPWVCCRGCTTGPPRAPSGSCGRSSRSGPTSPRRTCWRSARATRTARPPSRSP